MALVPHLSDETLQSVTIIIMMIPFKTLLNLIKLSHVSFSQIVRFLHIAFEPKIRLSFHNSIFHYTLSVEMHIPCVDTQRTHRTLREDQTSRAVVGSCYLESISSIGLLSLGSGNSIYSQADMEREWYLTRLKTEAVHWTKKS